MSIPRSIQIARELAEELAWNHQCYTEPQLKDLFHACHTLAPRDPLVEIFSSHLYTSNMPFAEKVELLIASNQMPDLRAPYKQNDDAPELRILQLIALARMRMALPFDEFDDPVQGALKSLEGAKVFLAAALKKSSIEPHRHEGLSAFLDLEIRTLKDDPDFYTSTIFIPLAP